LPSRIRRTTSSLMQKARLAASGMLTWPALAAFQGLGAIEQPVEEGKGVVSPVWKSRTSSRPPAKVAAVLIKHGHLATIVAERGVLKEGAPILLKFVTQVAARFGLVVTQKVAAQALPLVGALAVQR
jgi:hypothetical protein